MLYVVTYMYKFSCNVTRIIKVYNKLNNDFLNIFGYMKILEKVKRNQFFYCYLLL